jgi:HEAT repeat protein
MARLILCLLSSFIVGLVLGLWAGSSASLASKPSADGAGEESLYQGQPTSFWIGQLQDRAPAFRQQAIQTLELIGPKEEAVLPALAGMLKDRNTGVRLGAAVALRRIGPAAGSAVPELSAALHDENQHVLNAVCALGSISPQDEAVVAALTAALHDTSPMVRVRILKTLAESAPGSQAALAAVRAALQDNDAEVRQAAGDALEKMGRREDFSHGMSKIGVRFALTQRSDLPQSINRDRCPALDSSGFAFQFHG